MVARINKLADPDLYTNRQRAYAATWRNPAGLLHLPDGATVSDKDFLALWRGFAPQNAGPLTRRAISGAHKPGFDIVLSPDKSISALWAISSDFDRERIERAVTDAARVALTGTLLRYCATTRIGTAAGKLRVETGNILAAIAPFHISRELDPQLDVSCVIFNLVKTHSDGRFRTLHGYPFYSWTKAIGATFRNRLAHRLRSRLGLSIERHGVHSEYTRVRHMDRNLEELWSKRNARLQTHFNAVHAAWRTPDPAASDTGASTTAPLRIKRTATETDIARFRAEASGIVDPDHLHALVVRSAFHDVTEQEGDGVRQEIDDIPRALAATDLVFNTADIVTRVENAAGGLFDDTAMNQWLEYALTANNLLPLEHDDPNPDAVAGMAHKRLFTTRDIVDSHRDHKRLSGLTEQGAHTEPSLW